jgi:hypothetical protein
MLLAALVGAYGFAYGFAWLNDTLADAPFILPGLFIGLMIIIAAATIFVFIFFTLAFSKRAKITLDDTAISVFNPMRMTTTQIVYSDITRFKPTRIGWSIFARANDKLRIAWRTDGKPGKLLFTPENIDEFSELVNAHIAQLST